MYLTTNNLLSKEQHGFRPEKSGVARLLETMEDWIGYIDEDNNVDVIYLDLRQSQPHTLNPQATYKLWH